MYICGVKIYALCMCNFSNEMCDVVCFCILFYCSHLRVCWWNRSNKNNNNNNLYKRHNAYTIFIIWIIIFLFVCFYLFGSPIYSFIHLKWRHNKTMTIMPTTTKLTKFHIQYYNIDLLDVCVPSQCVLVIFFFFAFYFWFMPCIYTVSSISFSLFFFLF